MNSQFEQSAQTVKPARSHVAGHFIPLENAVDIVAVASLVHTTASMQRKFAW